MKIKIEEFERKDFAPDSHKGRIAELIEKLSSYINAPIDELKEALPQLEALEKQCQDFDAMQGKPKICYIMVILAELYKEQKNRKAREHLKDDEESLFWKMAMVFKEKLEKIRTVRRTKFWG